jgi:hypothetical protein
MFGAITILTKNIQASGDIITVNFEGEQSGRSLGFVKRFSNKLPLFDVVHIYDYLIQTPSQLP